MKLRILTHSGLVLALFALAPAHAQTVTQTITQGGSGGGVHVLINNDQKLMLEAAEKVMRQDYQAAESLYSQAVALNGNNIEAHLQRGVVRRERGDAAGAAADAQAVVSLTDAALQARPNDPLLYYQRGMGYRLLKKFGQARDDIRKGMRIGGKSSWETDLKAIDIEEQEMR